MTRVQVLAVSLVTILVPLCQARACSRLGLKSIRGLTVLPLEGTSAPKNTKLWVVSSPDELAEYSLNDASGRPVQLTRNTVTVTGEWAANLEILTPLSHLEPGAWVFARNGSALSHFTVTNELDLTAPPALSPTVSSVVGEYFGSLSCGNSALVTLDLGGEAELALAVAEGQDWPASEVSGAARGTLMDLTSQVEGDYRFVVLHVDLAGNATSSEVVSATVPRKERGCSATGGQFSVGLVALLMTARARRRAFSQA